MTALDVLGIIAGALAGLAVFLFCFGVLQRSNALLIAGAGCLAGFITCTLGWVVDLVHAR